jgi:UDP-N-acetyl-2-amino-2-deoxyglucuronate dehydrogenase
MGDHGTLRVGLVGCGRHGLNLAEAIRRTPSMRLVACADTDDAATAQVLAVTPGASAHGSLNALLAGAQIDAVVVATPHDLLTPLSLTALRAGKHVMAEKPIGIDEREAAEIEAVAAAKDLRFMSGYSFRFSMLRYLRELLDSGAVGAIRGITGAMTYPPMDVGWKAAPESGGGPLLFVGSHLIDAFLWFLNEPLEVYADVEVRPDTGAENTVSFQVRFADGVLTQGLVTQAASGFGYEIDIHGSEGRIVLRGHSFLQFDIEVVSRVIAAYREPTVIRPQASPDNVDMMLVPELKEFCEAVHQDRAPSITARDGRRVLKITDAIRESARIHGPVTLRH